VDQEVVAQEQKRHIPQAEGESVRIVLSEVGGPSSTYFSHPGKSLIAILENDSNQKELEKA
jgi:hypothetical protein